MKNDQPHEPEEIFDLPDFPSRRSAPYLLQLLSRLMTADYVMRTASTGIAPAQTYVLRELWRAEPLSQVEISQRLDIGKATVGQTLKRLERAGLIERKRSETDGRIVVVQLTEKGWAARDPLAVAAREQLADIDTLLGDDAVTTLADLLEQLIVFHRKRLKQ